jgi:hypothetical protein
MGLVGRGPSHEFSERGVILGVMRFVGRASQAWLVSIGPGMEYV